MSVININFDDILEKNKDNYEYTGTYEKILTDVLICGESFISKRKSYEQKRDKIKLSHDFLEIKNFEDSQMLRDIKQDPWNFGVKVFAMLSNKPVNEGGFSQLFQIEKLVIVYSHGGQDKIAFAAPDSEWLVKRISKRAATTKEVIHEHHGFMQSEPGIQALKPIKIEHPVRYYINSRNQRRTSHYNYYPMQTIKGVSLTDLIRRFNQEGRSFHERTHLAQSILEAYQQHIVEKGLIHLDIKPDNILIGEDGRVTIIDFGTHRKITDAPQIIETQGSLPYCDQEGYQVPVSDAIDTYSLGVIIAEILGATHPETYVIDMLREIKTVATQLLVDKPEVAAMDASINALLAQKPCLDALAGPVKAYIRTVIAKIYEDGTSVDSIDGNTDLQMLLYRYYDFPALLENCTGGMPASEKQALQANFLTLLRSTRGELSARKGFAEILSTTLALAQMPRPASSNSSSSSSSYTFTGHTSSLFPSAPYRPGNESGDEELPSLSEMGTPFGLSSPAPSLSDLSLSTPPSRRSPSSPCSSSLSDFPSGSSPETASSILVDDRDKAVPDEISSLVLGGFSI